MPSLIDETGSRFERLVVKRRDTSRKGTAWVCDCDCGNTVSVSGSNLRSGNTRSCGCLHAERASIANKTHGKARTRLYGIWAGINRRCLSPSRHNYSDYGGRGIGVCDEWSRGDPNGFVNFMRDMGERPSPGHSIDRIDNNADYSPENCRWATQSEQSNNQRSNIRFTYRGRTQTITQWARETGVNNSTAFKRIKRGQAVAEALELEGNKS